MELPKHTTQVGTIAVNKKMYIEDYCISYMKQLGEEYPEDRKQIALFGTVEREKNVEYAFCYGAVLLGCGKGRTDSLTNAQKEEAENVRQEHFLDYQLIGIVITTDQVDENVFWLGNGNKSIPLDGYYIFYDKNETMLNFMMQNQKEERGLDLDPVIAKKADMEREKREKKEKEEQKPIQMQQKRGTYRQKMQKQEKTEPKKKKTMFPATACVLVVAIAGVYTLKADTLQEFGVKPLSDYVSGLMDKNSIFTNNYLETEVQETVAEVLETSETETMKEELLAVVETQVQKPEALEVIVIPEPETIETAASTQVQEEAMKETTEVQPETAESEAVIAEQQPKSYLIQKGDSLIRILRAYYGDESLLDEVCNMNQIADPDNIQVGQTILLP